MLPTAGNVHNRKAEPFDETSLDAVVATWRDMALRFVEHLFQGLAFFCSGRFHFMSFQFCEVCICSTGDRGPLTILITRGDDNYPARCLPALANSFLRPTVAFNISGGMLFAPPSTSAKIAICAASSTIRFARAAAAGSAPNANTP